MLNLGLGILLVACAATLSALQGWALRGPARRVRHVLAWLAGTVLVSTMLGVAWAIAWYPRDLPPGAPRPEVPTLPAPLATMLHWVVALGVAAALGAGALHARQLAGDRHESERDAWIGRAVVQGIALVVVGAIGFVALLLTALGQIR